MPEGDLPNQYTRSVDIFAYGLLVLELVSKRKLDVNRNTSWQVSGAMARRPRYCRVRAGGQVGGGLDLAGGAAAGLLELGWLGGEA
jgi:hypothetical protein